MKLLKGLLSAQGTKRALIASAACTLLCGLLLFSTSIAWFTANRESNLNELYSGNLDIELSYSKNMTEWNEVTNTTDNIFKVKKTGETEEHDMRWEPGAVNVVYFKIENKGNLAAKYDFAVEIAEEKEGTNFNEEPNNNFKLSDYIKGGVVENITEALGRENAINAVELAYGDVKTLQQIHTDAPLITGKMDGIPVGVTPGENQEKIFALVLYMPENAGDVTNYKTGEENKPTLKLKVKLVATQDVGESDSFGDKYDENAEVIMVLAGETSTKTNANVKQAIAGAEKGSTILLPEAKGENKITLPSEVADKDVVIKGAGQDKTEIANNTAQGISGNLSIQDVTFVGAEKGVNYIGFQHTSTETYENCKFTGIRFFYGNTVVCKNCVFEQADYEYCFWTYGAENITFENCTFNTKGKAAKVYNEAGTGTYNITFNNCHFKIVEGYNNTGNKPAVAIASCGAKFNVTMTGCDQTGYKSKQDSALTNWYNAAIVPDEAAYFFGCECITNKTVTPETTGKLSDMTVVFNGTTYICPAN